MAIPEITSSREGIMHKRKAISSLLPAGILLNLFIWVLCFSTCKNMNALKSLKFYALVFISNSPIKIKSANIAALFFLR
jgi:hypothetical protein